MLYDLWSFSIFFPEYTVGIRLREIRVPNHTIKHNTVRLECHYDLENEVLYSVKWYKDGNEFYSFRPREQPPARIFDHPGISVDV